MQHVIQIKNGIIKHVTVNAKSILYAKKNVVGIHVFVRIVTWYSSKIFMNFVNFSCLISFGQNSLIPSIGRLLSRGKATLPCKNIFTSRLLKDLLRLKIFDPIQFIKEYTTIGMPKWAVVLRTATLTNG